VIRYRVVGTWYNFGLVLSLYNTVIVAKHIFVTKTTEILQAVE
jgi:hypothetical protein